MTQITYTVLIPLKDEEGNVRALIEELEPIMEGLNTPWELICVDDGSTDNTPVILQELAQTKPFLRVLTFQRNYGQSSAFAAGFEHARGDYVITMDGDRQNDPADIPKLLEAMRDCDMACGSRKKRRDTLWRRTISRAANSVRRWACKDGMKDNNCSLKAYRRACLSRINTFEGMHRFLPALFIMNGFIIKEIPVNHRERTQGKSKYNLLNRGLNTLFDLLAVVWMRKRTVRYQLKQDGNSRMDA